MTESAPRALCRELALRTCAERTGVIEGALADIVRRRTFDTLGALAAGAEVDASGVFARMTDRFGCPVNLLDRVRYLCAAVRCSEVDDIDRQSCTTPGSVSVPVSLVLAAARGVGGQDVLAAIVAGYEIMVSIGDALDGAKALYRGIWPSYFAAPLAAAAAAARVLAFDAERTAQALSIAATRVSRAAPRGRREPTSRWMAYGAAAADGVLATLAVEAGLEGDPETVESGLAAIASGGFDRSLADRSQEDTKRIERTDVKPFCTAAQTQAAVEAAQLAAAEVGEVAIERIEVRVPETYRTMIDQPHPTDRLASIVSAQFQIAAALTQAPLLYEVQRRNPCLASAGQRLLPLIQVLADQELTALFPALWPAQVRITAADGRTTTHCVYQPEGCSRHNPGWEMLISKHKRLGALRANLEPVLEVCRGLGGPSGVPAQRLLDLTLNSATKEANV